MTKNEFKKRISHLFLWCRQARRLSQVEVARKIGVSQAYISKVESAALLPDAYVWISFCEEFLIPPRSASDLYPRVEARLKQELKRVEKEREKERRLRAKRMWTNRNY